MGNLFKEESKRAVEQVQRLRAGLLTQACHPSTQEARRQISMNLKPACELGACRGYLMGAWIKKTMHTALSEDVRSAPSTCDWHLVTACNFSSSVCLTPLASSRIHIYTQVRVHIQHAILKVNL